MCGSTVRKDMKLLGRTLIQLSVGLGFFTGVFAGSAGAQNPFTAPSDALDTLNEAPNASGAGNAAKNKAANLANPKPGGAGAPAAGGAKRRLSLDPNVVGKGAALKDAAKAVTRVVKPRVKAIMGTRVMDSVTGELLDDAQLQWADQTRIGELGLVDDGTKGDPVPNDGQYANVEKSTDFIGQSNQRLKERLIQAIYSAEQLDPLDFYGFNLMTTERHNPAPRNRRWQMVADPKGGHGFRLAEVETEKPLQVPKYREWEQERDKKISGKDGWAIRFLDEYRKEKGKVDSEFYPIHIPMPPVAPPMPPPAAKDWQPFPNPQGPKQGNQPGNNPSQYSKYGYKVKGAPGAAGEIGNLNGTMEGGSKPYFDSGNVNKYFKK